MTPEVEQLVAVAEIVASKEEVPSLLRLQLSAAASMVRDAENVDPLAARFGRFVARCRARETA